MKKIDLGQAISILANLGVVGGLVLLAIEINQSNSQAEASAFQARITEIEQSRKQFALFPDLPAIYVKLSESGLTGLTEEEKSRIASWEAARALRLTGQHHQFLRGYLDEETHSAIVVYAATMQDFWAQLGVEITDSSFRVVIDATYPSVQPLSAREITDR